MRAINNAKREIEWKITFETLKSFWTLSNFFAFPRFTLPDVFIQRVKRRPVVLVTFVWTNICFRIYTKNLMVLWAILFEFYFWVNSKNSTNFLKVNKNDVRGKEYEEKQGKVGKFALEDLYFDFFSGRWEFSAFDVPLTWRKCWTEKLSGTSCFFFQSPRHL